MYIGVVLTIGVVYWLLNYYLFNSNLVFRCPFTYVH